MWMVPGSHTWGDIEPFKDGPGGPDPPRAVRAPFALSPVHSFLYAVFVWARRALLNQLRSVLSGPDRHARRPDADERWKQGEH